MAILVHVRSDGESDGRYTISGRDKVGGKLLLGKVMRLGKAVSKKSGMYSKSLVHTSSFTGLYHRACLANTLRSPRVKDIRLHQPLLITLRLSCRPAEAVMSDTNLAWAITQTLLSSGQNMRSYDVKEWYALSSVNRAFRDAVEGQPLTVHLPQQLSKEQRWCLQQTKLSITELHCWPGDALVTLILLSEQFRLVLNTLKQQQFMLDSAQRPAWLLPILPFSLRRLSLDTPIIHQQKWL